LEGIEVQSTIPSEAQFATPLKVEEGSDFRIWWHFIPVRITIIPFVASKTKNDEMNPLGGLLGCVLPMVLNIGKHLDTLH
jgi:hypothetical protein